MARKSSAVLGLSCAALLVSAAAGTQPPEVRSPWVTTDRTVDCSSYESIAAGVVRPGMTTEQKAIAMYDFYRQRVYHYRNMPESRNPLKCVNVLGNTLCGSQATCMKGLLAAVGIKARAVTHPGHTFYEAFYDGKWHGYDTMCNFYVFTRGPGRNVASFAELNADPSLIRDAVPDGRACPGMCPCGDKPMSFAQKTRVLNYEPQKSDWSVKDYALRPGEEIVRSWWPLGRPLPGTHRSSDPGPLHTCGSKDRRNPPELFRFWEPYGIAKYGGVSISYRHYVNGWMAYSPDPSDPAVKDALAKGELVVPVKCPFYLSAARVEFEATCPGDGGSAVEVAASVDGKWQTVLTAKQPGRRPYRASLDGIVVRPKVGRHEYKLRFGLRGKAALHRFYLKTIFVHNAMAAPHLMPGRNRVTVTAADPAAVQAHPLTLVYRYKDAPAWTELRTIEKRIAASPTTFSVNLPKTDTLPQMQDLTLRCGTLHWTPKHRALPARVLCDFSDAAAVRDWSAGDEMKVSHDGVGMVLAVAAKATYPQAARTGPPADWSEFDTIVIEGEVLTPQPQEIVFRVRSNETNDERTDVQQRFGPGKFVMRVPLSGLKKTRLNAVTKVYLMTYQVPAAGCRVRFTRIVLQPRQEL